MGNDQSFAPAQSTIKIATSIAFASFRLGGRHA